MTQETQREIRRRYNAGERLFSEGDSGAEAFYLLHGELELSVEIDGATRTIARAGAGTIVGELALLDKAPRSASAIAGSELEVVVITQEYLNSRLDSSDPIVRSVLNTVLDRFREMRSRFLSLAEGQVSDALSVKVEAGGDSLSSDGVHGLLFEEELLRAVHQEEFTLVFQPLFNLAQRTVVGFEALIRWNHPSGKQMSPAAFIDFAEQNDVIKVMGLWVVKSACEGLLRINDAVGHQRFSMNVNLSGRQFDDSDLAQKVHQIVADAGLTPNQLKLEITERLLLSSDDSVVEQMEQFDEMGYRIVMDDFGTGFSSLSYLQKYPLSVLKVDRSFVARIADDQRHLKLLESILGMGHALEMVCVAEGIETDEQATLLNQLGCELGQGYFLGRPMPLDSVLEQFADGTLSG